MNIAERVSKITSFNLLLLVIEINATGKQQQQQQQTAALKWAQLKVVTVRVGYGARWLRCALVTVRAL